MAKAARLPVRGSWWLAATDDRQVRADVVLADEAGETAMTLVLPTG